MQFAAGQPSTRDDCRRGSWVPFLSRNSVAIPEAEGVVPEEHRRALCPTRVACVSGGHPRDGVVPPFDRRPHTSLP